MHKNKFTIPKISASRELLQACDTSSREYKQITSEIEHSLWNAKCGLEIKRIETVNNESLSIEFNKRKQEMQKESTKRQEIMYGFKYVESYEQAKELCKTGLKAIGGSRVTCLGDPKYGVYLSRCADVLTRIPPRLNKQMILVVFQVIKGRLKTIQEQHGTEGDLMEPTPSHNGHISKDFRKIEPGALRNPSNFPKIFDSCQMYLYEIDMDLEDLYAKKPRHCIPYAVVYHRFVHTAPPESMAVETQSKAPIAKLTNNHPSSSKLGDAENSGQEDYVNAELEKALTLWAGKLYNKSTALTDVKIICHATEFFGHLPLYSNHLSIRMKMMLSHLKDSLPHSLYTTPPVDSKSPKVLKRGREFLHCEMYPQNKRSTTFARLKRSLKLRSEVLVLKLAQGYDLLIIPTSDLTKRLGITFDGYPEALHLLFTRKVLDENELMKKNESFLKDAKSILFSRLQELEKLKMTAPKGAPPPVEDVGNDSESPFHDDGDWTEYPLFFTEMEKEAIKSRIQRVRHAATKEMFLAGNLKYQPSYKTPYFTAIPGASHPIILPSSNKKPVKHHYHEQVYQETASSHVVRNSFEPRPYGHPNSVPSTDVHPLRQDSLSGLARNSPESTFYGPARDLRLQHAGYVHRASGYDGNDPVTMRENEEDHVTLRTSLQSSKYDSERVNRIEAVDSSVPAKSQIYQSPALAEESIGQSWPSTGALETGNPTRAGKFQAPEGNFSRETNAIQRTHLRTQPPTLSTDTQPREEFYPRTHDMHERHPVGRSENSLAPEKSFVKHPEDYHADNAVNRQHSDTVKKVVDPRLRYDVAPKIADMPPGFGNSSNGNLRPKAMPLEENVSFSSQNTQTAKKPIDPRLGLSKTSGHAGMNKQVPQGKIQMTPKNSGKIDAAEQIPQDEGQIPNFSFAKDVSGQQLQDAGHIPKAADKVDASEPKHRHGGHILYVSGTVGASVGISKDEIKKSICYPNATERQRESALKPQRPNLKLTIPDVSHLSHSFSQQSTLSPTGNRKPEAAKVDSSVSATVISSEVTTAVSLAEKETLTNNTDVIMSSSEKRPEKPPIIFDECPNKNKSQSPLEVNQPRKADEHRNTNSETSTLNRKVAKGAGSKFSTSRFWKQSGLPLPQDEKDSNQQRIGVQMQNKDYPMKTFASPNIEDVNQRISNQMGSETANFQRETRHDSITPPPLPPILANLLSPPKAVYLEQQAQKQPVVTNYVSSTSSILLPSILDKSGVFSPDSASASVETSRQIQSIGTKIPPRDVQSHPMLKGEQTTCHEKIAKTVETPCRNNVNPNQSDLIQTSKEQTNAHAIPLPSPPALTPFMQSVLRSTNSAVIDSSNVCQAPLSPLSTLGDLKQGNSFLGGRRVVAQDADSVQNTQLDKFSQPEYGLQSKHSVEEGVNEDVNRAELINDSTVKPIASKNGSATLKDKLLDLSPSNVDTPDTLCNKITSANIVTNDKTSTVTVASESEMNVEVSKFCVASSTENLSKTAMENIEQLPSQQRSVNEISVVRNVKIPTIGAHEALSKSREVTRISISRGPPDSVLDEGEKDLKVGSSDQGNMKLSKRTVTSKDAKLIGNAVDDKIHENETEKVKPLWEFDGPNVNKRLIYCDQISMPKDVTPGNDEAVMLITVSNEEQICGDKEINDSPKEDLRAKLNKLREGKAKTPSALVQEKEANGGDSVKDSSFERPIDGVERKINETPCNAESGRENRNMTHTVVRPEEKRKKVIEGKSPSSEKRFLREGNERKRRRSRSIDSRSPTPPWWRSGLRDSRSRRYDDSPQSHRSRYDSDRRRDRKRRRSSGSDSPRRYPSRRRREMRHRDYYRSSSYSSSSSRSRDRSRDRSRNRSRERSRERSRDRSRNRSLDRSRNRSRERSRERSRDKSRNRSLDRSRDKSRDRIDGSSRYRRSNEQTPKKRQNIDRKDDSKEVIRNLDKELTVTPRVKSLDDVSAKKSATLQASKSVSSNIGSAKDIQTETVTDADKVENVDAKTEVKQREKKSESKIERMKNKPKLSFEGQKITTLVTVRHEIEDHVEVPDAPIESQKISTVVTTRPENQQASADGGGALNWYDKAELMKYDADNNCNSKIEPSHQKSGSNLVDVQAISALKKAETQVKSSLSKEEAKREKSVSADQIFDEIYRPSSPTKDIDTIKMNQAISDENTMRAFNVKKGENKPNNAGLGSPSIPEEVIKSVNDLDNDLVHMEATEKGMEDNISVVDMDLSEEESRLVDLDLSEGESCEKTMETTENRRLSFDSEQGSQEKADEISLPDVAADSSNIPSSIMQSLMSSSQNVAKVLSKGLPHVIEPPQTGIEVIQFDSSNEPSSKQAVAVASNGKQAPNKEAKSTKQGVHLVSKPVVVVNALSRQGHTASSSSLRKTAANRNSPVSVSSNTRLSISDCRTFVKVGVKESQEKGTDHKRDVCQAEKSGSLSPARLNTPWINSQYASRNDVKNTRKEDVNVKDVEKMQGRTLKTSCKELPVTKSQPVKGVKAKENQPQTRHGIERQKRREREGSHSNSEAPSNQDSTNESVTKRYGINNETSIRKRGSVNRKSNSVDSAARQFTPEQEDFSSFSKKQGLLSPKATGRSKFVGTYRRGKPVDSRLPYNNRNKNFFDDSKQDIQYHPPVEEQNEDLDEDIYRTHFRQKRGTVSHQRDEIEWDYKDLPTTKFSKRIYPHSKAKMRPLLRIAVVDDLDDATDDQNDNRAFEDRKFNFDRRNRANDRNYRGISRRENKNEQPRTLVENFDLVDDRPSDEQFGDYDAIDQRFYNRYKDLAMRDRLEERYERFEEREPNFDYEETRQDDRRHEYSEMGSERERRPQYDDQAPFHDCSYYDARDRGTLKRPMKNKRPSRNLEGYSEGPSRRNDDLELPTYYSEGEISDDFSHSQRSAYQDSRYTDSYDNYDDQRSSNSRLRYKPRDRTEDVYDFRGFTEHRDSNKDYLPDEDRYIEERPTYYDLDDDLDDGKYYNNRQEYFSGSRIKTYGLDDEDLHPSRNDAYQYGRETRSNRKDYLREDYGNDQETVNWLSHRYKEQNPPSLLDIEINPPPYDTAIEDFLEDSPALDRRQSITRLSALQDVDFISDAPPQGLNCHRRRLEEYDEEFYEYEDDIIPNQSSRPLDIIYQRRKAEARLQDKRRIHVDALDEERPFFGETCSDEEIQQYSRKRKLPSWKQRFDPMAARYVEPEEWP